MTDRAALDAAFDYFDSIGFCHGDKAARHAATMRAWAADVQGWVEATRAEVARADRVVAAVNQALDGCGSLADVAGAIADLLAHQPPALTGGAAS